MPVITGSPPQVRGKPKQKKVNRKKSRITPAGAGKTKPRRSDLFFAEDHPRRCGENSLESKGLDPSIGSPPQVRGKRCAFMRAARVLRITPAGAGKTWVAKKIKLGQEDHPRRCGENATGKDPTEE